MSVEQWFQESENAAFLCFQPGSLVFEAGVAAKARLIGFKYDKGVLQFRSVLFGKPDYGAWKRGTCISGKPYQDYPGGICVADENQPSEIFVFGE